MNTAKHLNRNDFSSIHARIGDMLSDTWGKNPTPTRLSRKTPTLSSTFACQSDTRSAAPRLWNETLAFAADG